VLDEPDEELPEDLVEDPLDLTFEPELPLELEPSLLTGVLTLPGLL
jgi:hypothetical protein